MRPSTGNDMARMMMRRAMRSPWSVGEIPAGPVRRALMQAADAPLYVFDDGLGSGVLSIEEQTELAHKTGYAGISTTARRTSPNCSPRTRRGA